MNVSSWRQAKTSDEWYTPEEIIRSLGSFDLDPACGSGCLMNTAARKIGPDEDGLKQEWKGRVWLNPPFSRAREFIEKMTQHNDGVALVFSRTDARWWQEAVRKAGAVFVFSGRLSFWRPGAPKANCPVGCCLIPFGARNREAVKQAGLKGIYMEVST